MKAIVQSYFATLASFLVIDAVWLTFVAKPIYTEALGSLMRSPPGLVSAAAFYAVYCAGVVYFAVQPLAEKVSFKTVVLNGALLGLLSYGTFAATNYSVLQAWTPSLAVTDTLWGVVLTAVAAICGHAAVGR